MCFVISNMYRIIILIICSGSIVYSFELVLSLKMNSFNSPEIFRRDTSAGSEDQIT